jgi:hypothetical protein
MSFIAPLFLLGIPLSVVYLLWLYRKGGRARPITVPSLYLLKHLQGDITVKKKWYFPWEILLHLLILITLILLLARPFTKAKKALIIIDNSVSGERLTKNGSYLKVMRDTIYNRSKEIKSYKIDYLLTCPQNTLIKESIHGLKIPFCPTDGKLTLSDEFLGPYQKIWIFSDRDLSSSPPSGMSFFSLKDLPPLPNLAISKVKIVKRELFITILSSYEKEEQITLTISDALSNKSLKAKAFSVSPKESLLKVLLTPVEGDRYYRVEVKTQNSEDLLIDNLAWVNEEKSNFIITNTSLDLGIEPLGYTLIKYESPFKGTVKGGILFGKGALENDYQFPTLIILDSSAVNEKALVSSSILEHPINRGIKFENLLFPKISPDILQGDELNIIETSSGPALIERKAAKQLIASFNPFPFNEESSTREKVLLLNIFQYLFTTRTSSLKNLTLVDDSFHRLIDERSNSEIHISGLYQDEVTREYKSVNNLYPTLTLFGEPPLKIMGLESYRERETTPFHEELFYDQALYFLLGLMTLEALFWFLRR